MQKSFRGRFAAPLICSALLVACGGSDGMNDERRAQQPMTNQPEHGAAEATVALSGCLEGAPGTDQYTLRNVRFAADAANNPHKATTTPGPHGITEGSWVRLNGSGREEEIRGYVGQRVTLTGTITDSGRNTIGPAGTSGVAVPSGDESKAASDEDYPDKVRGEAGRIARESMANGTAAQVKVTNIQSSGERCQTEARPERR